MRAGLRLTTDHEIDIRLKPWPAALGLDRADIHIDGIIDACHDWRPRRRHERAGHPKLSVDDDMIYFKDRGDRLDAIGIRHGRQDIDGYG